MVFVCKGNTVIEWMNYLWVVRMRLEEKERHWLGSTSLEFGHICDDMKRVRMKDQRLSQKAVQIIPSTEIIYVNCEAPNLPLELVPTEIAVRLTSLPPFVFGFIQPLSSGPCWVMGSCCELAKSAAPR